MPSIQKSPNLTISFVIFILSLGLALGCGTPAIPPSFGARIINGEEARPNSWPWMVIYTFDSRNWCGGSILDKDTILTAAHCIDFITNVSRLEIVVGKHNLSSPNINNLYSVSRIIIHPQWNTTTVRNDVAILKLTTSLIFSNEVFPVCLPSANSHSFLYGKNVVATGWGRTQSGEPADLLQQAQLKVINETFFYLLNGTIFVPSEQYAVIEYVDRNNSDTNTCSGDSGGPLVYFDGNKWTLYGVTSYGFVDNAQNCLTSLPSVFQSVPFYLEFINGFLNSSATSTIASTSTQQQTDTRSVNESSTTTTQLPTTLITSTIAPTTTTRSVSTPTTPTIATTTAQSNSSATSTIASTSARSLSSSTTPALGLNSRKTTWITGDPHVSSYKKGYQICTFDEQEVICFNSSRFTIYCSDKILTQRSVTVLSQIRIVYNSNGSSFSYVANNISFPSTFSNGKSFISDEKNKTLFEIVDNSINFKSFVDYSSETNIFISSWNLFYTLTFRATEGSYSSSTGILVDGCSGSRQVNSTTQLTKRATLAECEQSCRVFANSSVESVEMTKNTIFDICFFDCRQIGNTSFTQMLTQSIEAVNRIQQTDTRLVNESSITTTQFPTTSTTSTTTPSTQIIDTTRPTASSSSHLKHQLSSSLILFFLSAIFLI
jgi:chymotrypsin